MTSNVKNTTVSRRLVAVNSIVTQSPTFTYIYVRTYICHVLDHQPLQRPSTPDNLDVLQTLSKLPEIPCPSRSDIFIQKAAKQLRKRRIVRIIQAAAAYRLSVASATACFQAPSCTPPDSILFISKKRRRE